jgi:flagellar biogenesis protein FliO
MAAPFLRTIRVGFCLCLFFYSAMQIQAMEKNKSQNKIAASSDVIPLSASSTISDSTIASASPVNHIDQIFAALQQQWDNPSPSRITSTTTTGTYNIPTSDPSLMNSLGKMLISLAFVILLGLTIAWALKKYLIKSHTLGGEYIERMGSYALSQKSKVHLLRVGSEFYLVGEGGNSVSLISKVDLSQAKTISETEEAPVQQPGIAPANFKNSLSHWQKSLENQDMSQEVNASLLFLKGLSQRLKRKGDQNA